MPQVSYRYLREDITEHCNIHFPARVYQIWLSIDEVCLACSPQPLRFCEPLCVRIEPLNDNGVDVDSEVRQDLEDEMNTYSEACYLPYNVNLPVVLVDTHEHDEGDNPYMELIEQHNANPRI